MHSEAANFVGVQILRLDMTLKSNLSSLILRIWNCGIFFLANIKNWSSSCWLKIDVLVSPSLIQTLKKSKSSSIFTFSLMIVWLSAELCSSAFLSECWEDKSPSLHSSPCFMDKAWAVLICWTFQVLSRKHYDAFYKWWCYICN